MSRVAAVNHALQFFDAAKGGYFDVLAELCAIPTESQNPARLPEMKQYIEQVMSPRFEAMGYGVKVYANPVAGAGPVLLATRIEDPSLPTVLCYGHGDVVLGMEGRWEGDRDPWRLSFEGDKVYGRGVADNKGQHLVHMAAIEAILKTRGKLGFNHKFLIEMGEENGSKGLAEIVAANKADFATDAFFASDGPRTEMSKPNITLGNRGCCNFNLVVELREGGHHSGNWGGLLANPAIILAHAIATIADDHGKILVDGWRPEVPQHVRDVLVGIDRQAGPGAPEINDDWGEPGFTRMEKMSAFNSFEVLAFTAGNPDKPVNAIPPSARATCQLRYVHGTDEQQIIPNLRKHLDAAGFSNVRIDPPPSGNDGVFKASRTDPRHPWAQWMKAAVERGSNHPCGVLPNSGGSNMTHIIQFTLDAPITWLPLSYAGCSQHAPNEHIIKPLMREGLRHVTGIYWDLGDPATAYRL
ncbi:MAG: M20/M25/M40 family metallo-hydrolase [Hyphomicrobiaceae bacterium]|nr:M20/M25/M40 family metallo-hydrolase [Hyphomicrobiaceae bacterium]